MNDTPYYLLDATVREARGAPTGRMSTFDGALDTAMWVFDTLRLDALCAAVAQVAEAKGLEQERGQEREWALMLDDRDALLVERAALRETVRDMKQVDAFRLITKLEQFAATIERLTQDDETMVALRAEVAALRKDAERLDWLERVATTRKAYPLTIAPAYNATGHVGAAVFTIGDCWARDF